MHHICAPGESQTDSKVSFYLFIYLFIYLFKQYLNRDITFSIASLKRALQKQNLTIQSYT